MAAVRRTRVGKYELGRTLGEGTFAKVKFAKNLETGENVAIKIFDKDKILRHKMVGQAFGMSFLIRCVILTRSRLTAFTNSYAADKTGNLNHETENKLPAFAISKFLQLDHVLQHFHFTVSFLPLVMASKTKIYMVLEFITGGELFDRIARNGKLKEDEARKYFQQLIDAVDYCHSRGVFHRDLKPENLLLDSNGVLKISDFGLSALPQQVREDGLLYTTCGTPNYVAPEIFKADFSCPSWFSTSAKKLIKRILDPKPQTRITIPEIIENEWFKKGYQPPHFETAEVNLDDVDAIFSESGDATNLVVERRDEKPVPMNAFDLISTSQGLNLGTLFEKQMGLVKRETRFTSKLPANEILSKIEEAAKPLGFEARKQNYKLKLQGEKSGRKGHLAIASEVFEVAPSLHVVELRKSKGDTLEFHKFYKGLSTALKDIMWKSQEETSGSDKKRLLFKDKRRARGDSAPGRRRTTRSGPGLDVEEIGEDGSPTEKEVQRSPGRWSSTATASEMRPREEAASPVDTVRRGGRSDEAVIEEGDGRRGSMEGSPNNVELEPMSFHAVSIYITPTPFRESVCFEGQGVVELIACMSEKGEEGGANELCTELVPSKSARALIRGAKKMLTFLCSWTSVADLGVVQHFLCDSMGCAYEIEDPSAIYGSFFGPSLGGIAQDKPVHGEESIYLHEHCRVMIKDHRVVDSFKMACMKLGSKPDAFRQQGQFWFCTTGLPSDLTVEVGDMMFHLHKFPLLSKSGLLEKQIKENSDKEETTVIKLHDLPGGAQAFELVVRFCYGVKLELDSSNVVRLRYASEHLQMTEEIAEGNLIAQTEIFFDQVVVRSWKDSMKALQTCSDFLPHAENLQLSKRCIDSLAVKAGTDPNLFGWPMMEHCAMQSPGGSALWNGISTGARPTNCRSDWWYEDVSSLTFPLYKRLISLMKSRGIRQETIAGSLTFYAKRYLPGLNRHQNLAQGTFVASPSEEEQRHLVEEIDSLLPLQKGVASTKILLGLLRTAMILQARPSCISNLEKRIGMQLDQADLEDLLFPTFAYSMEALYNVDCVKRMLDHFLATNQAAGGASPGSLNNEQSIGSPSSSMPITTVAKLIDGYLAEVAPDTNLKLPKFQMLAAAVPDYARPLDDGLYHAVDIYLKEDIYRAIIADAQSLILMQAHPWLSETQREQLCRLMDCQKLSLEACTHAAQNERLPLRVVVQVLFFEQLQLRTSVAGCLLVSDNLDGSRPLRSGIACSGEAGGCTPTAVRENKDLKEGMDYMRMRVSELEKACTTMKQEINKLGRGRSRWSSIWKKMPLCSAHEDSVSDQQKSEVGMIHKLQAVITKQKQMLLADASCHPSS
ncbi:BTB POZ domain-containing protein [Musa troglodytarum]|uniref:non-specific serine/threonine protein kinase n=1 Tax=Musa troglodytarum TaxID=320322 RepID=A0A9E7FH48_9LILI|nr:BTB POZ domain-containing protein [Musa troglodytarum]